MKSDSTLMILLKNDSTIIYELNDVKRNEATEHWHKNHVNHDSSFTN